MKKLLGIGLVILVWSNLAWVIDFVFKSDHGFFLAFLMAVIYLFANIVGLLMIFKGDYGDAGAVLWAFGAFIIISFIFGGWSWAALLNAIVYIILGSLLIAGEDDSSSSSSYGGCPSDSNFDKRDTEKELIRKQSGFFPGIKYGRIANEMHRHYWEYKIHGEKPKSFYRLKISDVIEIRNMLNSYILEAESKVRAMGREPYDDRYFYGNEQHEKELKRFEEIKMRKIDNYIEKVKERNRGY